MRFAPLSLSLREEIPFAYRDKEYFLHPDRSAPQKPYAFSMHSSDKSSLSVASPQRIAAFGRRSLKTHSAVG